MWRNDTKAQIAARKTVIARRKQTVEQGEAAAALVEAELHALGIRITFAEMSAEDKSAAALADAVRLADAAAAALVAEEEAEAKAGLRRQAAEAEAARELEARRARRLEDREGRATEKRALAETLALAAAATKREARQLQAQSAAAAKRAAQEARSAARAARAAPAVSAAAKRAAQEAPGSRFLPLFAANEQKRREEKASGLREGCRLFMSRFGLVPTTGARGEELVVGDLVLEADGRERLVACAAAALCVGCGERRACVDCGERRVCAFCARA
jgi:hypothetical protein